MRKHYIVIIISVIIMILGLSTYFFNDHKYQEEIKSKIRDTEVRHYTITSKEIVTRSIDEPYNCFIVTNGNSYWSALPFEITSEAKGSSGRSSSGSKSGSKSTPKTTPKSTPKAIPNTNTTPIIPRTYRSTKNGNSIEYDQDIAPDDNQINPLKGRAPSGKRWSCLYRSVNRYDYIVTDNDSSSYVFAKNSLSRDENPDNWNTINAGDPIAKIVEYENYFLAGTDPIFSPLKGQSLPLQEILLKEPNLTGVKNMRINQVYQTEKYYSPQDLDFVNFELMKVNSFLNNSENKKQVNIQIFFTNTDQEDYLRQLCIYRDGCNKNDLILTISLDNYNIKRIQGYSWSPTGFVIAIKLDSELTANPTSIKDRASISQLLSKIQNLTKNQFVRKEMSEFKYIKQQIERQVQKKLNN